MPFGRSGLTFDFPETSFIMERIKNMTREYATQMEAARKGIVTKEMEIVAKKERMTTEELLPVR